MMKRDNRTEMIVQMQSRQHLCGDKTPSPSRQWVRDLKRKTDKKNLQLNMLHGFGCDMFLFYFT